MDFVTFVSGVNYLILGIGCTGIFVSLGILVTRKKTPAQWYSLPLYLIFSLALFTDFFNHSLQYQQAPLFPYIFESLELFIGALFYHYFATLGEPDKNQKSWDQLLFVPAVLVLVLFLPYYVQNLAFRQAYYPQDHLSGLPLGVVYAFIMNYEDGWVLVCISLLVWRFRLLSRLHTRKLDPAFRKQRRAMVAYALAWMCVIVSFAVNKYYPVYLLHRITTLCASILGLCLYLMVQRHEAFFRGVQKRMVLARYQKSKLQGLNVKQVLEQLKDLVEDKKAYLDPNVSLQSLSKQLQIAPHQLSELLNKELSTTFRAFLNQYRIHEAKQKLLSCPDTPVLAVGFSCGFSSKTTFNMAFVKATGLTPTEYREAHFAQKPVV